MALEKSFIAIRSVITGCKSRRPALSSGGHLIPGLVHAAAVDALDGDALENNVFGKFSEIGLEVRPSREILPPRRTISNAVRIASGCPAISSTTSTPRPPVCSITIARTSSFDGSSAKSAFISLASRRRCSFTSMAKTCDAPTARATAMENSPIGPHPVIATVFAAISPASTLCTALPSGSRIDAYSCGIAGSSFQILDSGNDDVFGEGAVGVHADDLHVLADVGFAGAALQALAAGHVHLGGNEVAFLDAGDFIAERRHFSAEFVPGNQRGMNAVLRPAVPFVNVQVGAADGRNLHLDQHIRPAKGRNFDLADLRTRRAICFLRRLA